MSAHKVQMPVNYPEESIQHSQRGESLKSRITTSCIRAQKSADLIYFNLKSRFSIEKFVDANIKLF